MAGELAWSVNLDGSPINGGIAIFTNDEIFTATNDQNVFRVTARGDVKWSADNGPDDKGLVAGGFLNENGDYIVGSVSNSIRSYDFDTGDQRYNTETDAAAEDSAPALLGDYAVIGTNGSLYLFDPETGDIINTAGSDGDTAFDYSAALNGDHTSITVVDIVNDELVQFNTSLDRNWTVGLSDMEVQVLAIDEFDDIYVFNRGPQEVTKVSSNGNVLWTASIPKTDANISVDDEADRVYVFGSERSSSNPRHGWSLHAFTRSGNFQWSVEPNTSSLESGTHNVAIPTTDEGLFLGIGTELRKYTADGAMEWSVDLGSGPVVSGVAASTSGFVAVGTPDGTLHRVNTDAVPRYTLETANGSQWDYGRFRNNSGVFDPRVIMLEENLALQSGSNAQSGVDTVLYKENAARGELSVAEGGQVVMVKDDLAQG